MNRVRTPARVKSIPGPRVQAGRRVKAARFMAGGISARETAKEAGLSICTSSPSRLGVSRCSIPMLVISALCSAALQDGCSAGGGLSASCASARVMADGESAGAGPRCATS
jgi:hypothetical protein